MFIARWFQGFGPLIAMTSVLKVKEHKSDPLFLSVPEKDICFAPVSSSTLHSSYIKEKGEGNTSVLLDRKAYFGYLGANNFSHPYQSTPLANSVSGDALPPNWLKLICIGRYRMSLT